MALALGATQFLASLLFSVKPYDSDTFVLMSIVVLVVTFLACYLPARRATRIDPIAALRTE